MIEDEQSARAWLQNLPEYSNDAQARLECMVALLKEANRHQNLVSAPSLAQVWQRHIADSAQLLLYVPRGTFTWLDLGTGAGFPGIVAAVLRPETKFCLVESRPKRAAWLAQLCSTLELPHARVVESPLELIKTRTVSVISARAFAPLDRLLKLSARFSDADTQWLLPKGRSAAHSLQALTGWRHMFHVEQSLTDSEAGIIIGRLGGKAGGGR